MQLVHKETATFNKKKFHFTKIFESPFATCTTTIESKPMTSPLTTHCSLLHKAKNWVVIVNIKKNSIVRMRAEFTKRYLHCNQICMQECIITCNQRTTGWWNVKARFITRPNFLPVTQFQVRLARFKTGQPYSQPQDKLSKEVRLKTGRAAWFETCRSGWLQNHSHPSPLFPTIRKSSWNETREDKRRFNNTPGKTLEAD